MKHAAENMVSNLGELVTGLSDLVDRVRALETEVFSLTHNKPLAAVPSALAGPNIGSKVPEGAQS